VVVAGAVVVVGVVVVGARVVVGLGLVVWGAVVAGRVVGGALGTVARGAAGAEVRAGWVEVVVLGSTTVVSGVPRLVPPRVGAAAATVVGAGRGGAPGPPSACSASTTTIPAVATPVASQGRRNRATSHPVDSRTHRDRPSATLPHQGTRPGTGWVPFAS
jgi:hypothetical protein